MLIGIVAALQVTISLLLIFLILLHAGRGGGVSDMFGGGGGFGGSNAITGSSVVERNLDRLTVAAAIAFGITTVSLTMMTN